MDYDPPPPVPYHPHVVHRIVMAPSSGAATAALVFGIIGILGGWCLFGIPCVIAIICGHVGMADTKDGSKAGRGNAVAGLVLGYVCVVPMILVTVWLLVSFVGGMAAVMGGMSSTSGSSY